MARQLTPQPKTCLDCGRFYVGTGRLRVDRCIPCKRDWARFIGKIHKSVNRALRAKVLVREPCEVCKARAEPHHDDYSQPLSVRWLCHAHHRQHHEQEWRAARSAAENA